MVKGGMVKFPFGGRRRIMIDQDKGEGGRRSNGIES
jgi:hypothetical protein